MPKAVAEAAALRRAADRPRSLSPAPSAPAFDCARASSAAARLEPREVRAWLTRIHEAAQPAQLPGRTSSSAPAARCRARASPTTATATIASSASTRSTARRAAYFATTTWCTRCGRRAAVALIEQRDVAGSLPGATAGQWRHALRSSTTRCKPLGTDRVAGHEAHGAAARAARRARASASACGPRTRSGAAAARRRARRARTRCSSRRRSPRSRSASRRSPTRVLQPMKQARRLPRAAAAR